MIRIAYFSTGISGASTLIHLSECTRFKIVKVYTSSRKQGKLLREKGVVTVANRLGYPVGFVDNWDFIAKELLLNKIEAAIVCDFGKIVPERLIESIEGGWWNIHFSLLPKYRGATPLQSSILNGDKVTGTTVFKIENGIDTGKILCQKEIQLSPEDDFLTLSKRLSKISADLICQFLPKYLEGRIKLKPQKGKPSYCFKNLTLRENAKIDWRRNSVLIDRKVRALIPDPCAWTKIIINRREYEIKIVKGYVLKEALRKECRNIHKKVGKIMKKTDVLMVKCGKGVYCVEKLSVSGKGEMDAVSFWNGYLRNLENPMFF